MKGSIRTIAGLLIAMGGVGGIENNNALLPCMVIACLGLALMYNGTKAMKEA